MFLQVNTTLPPFEANWMMPWTGIIAAGGTHIAIRTSSNSPPPTPKLAVTMDVMIEQMKRNATMPVVRESGIKISSIVAPSELFSYINISSCLLIFLAIIRFPCDSHNCLLRIRQLQNQQQQKGK